jgi:hypothetical protein
VNFQVTVLKILVSYPDGFAAMEYLKRDMAILATSAANGRTGPGASPPGFRISTSFTRSGRTNQRRLEDHVQRKDNA